jgi:UDP-glucose 4-epimerase
MKILITGGAGFIGSHIQDKLIELGHEVAILDNLSSGKEKNINPQSKLYRIDLNDKEAIEQAFQEFRPEAVYHLAAQIDVGYSMSHIEEDARTNIIGTINLLEAASKVGIKKFIYSNTGGAYYGTVPVEDMPVAEDHPIHRPSSAYGTSKAAAELYVKFYADKEGFDYVALRYANVYGPRQDGNKETGVVAIFTKKIMEGEVPTINGDGEYYRDYVYVKDVVSANIKALDYKGSDYFNIGMGVGTSVNQVFSIITKLMGRSIEAQYGPERPGDVRACTLDTTKAQTKLGWQPQFDFESGIKETIEYYSEMH